MCSKDRNPILIKKEEEKRHTFRAYHQFYPFTKLLLKIQCICMDESGLIFVNRMKPAKQRWTTLIIWQVNSTLAHVRVLIYIIKPASVLTSWFIIKNINTIGCCCCVTLASRGLLQETSTQEVAEMWLWEATLVTIIFFKIKISKKVSGDFHLGWRFRYKYVWFRWNE